MKRRSILKALALSMVAVMAVASIPLLALGNNSNPSTDSQSAQPMMSGTNTSQISAVTFHDQWRHLWEDHVWYTREAIIDILSSSPNTNATIDRLLIVAADTRDMLRPYYGAEADTFYTQLVGHFTMAAQIVTALRDGADVTPLVNQWFANAQNMSTIMNQMNPQFWKVGPVNAMWDNHLNLTIQEATQFFKGQYNASIATFDMIENQGLMMADLFSNGIMDQFPQNFSERSCIASTNMTA